MADEQGQIIETSSNAFISMKWLVGLVITACVFVTGAVKWVYRRVWRPSYPARGHDDTISRLQSELSLLNRRKSDEIRRILEERDGLAREASKQREQLRDIRSDCERLKSVNQRLQGQLEKAEREKDDVLRRLSEVVGDRLVRNNPNITDLSDPYRPIKLADISSEIYDNEWTSAFSSLEEIGFEERECVDILLHIIMRVHTHCQAQVNGSLKALVNKDQEAVTAMKRLLKASFERIQADLYQVFYEDLSPEVDQKWPGVLKLNNIQMYTHASFTLCWYMAVQDPPTVFHYAPGVDSMVDLPPKMKFPKEYYRHYTKTGPSVDFIVWPILMLHAGGSVLSKGVAQAKSN